MADAITPFLMFQNGDAEEALNFYVSLFADSEIVEIVHHPEGGVGAEGTVLRATFRLQDQHILCMDSPVKHNFTFTPSTSFFIDCESEDELTRLHAALSDDGLELMPLGHYGFSKKFAWVNDKYGVSWQLNWA
jgi:predicted 3-demethylubiquinone-9 3-methyltransferase (glyoxalase superfamily)